MTRYELAAMAMQALIAREKYLLVLDHNGVQHLAEKACAIADIMLREFSAPPMPIVPKEPIGTKPVETVPPKPEVPWHEKPWSGKKDGDPVRHWVIWTRKDILKLARLHDNGVPIEAIAKALDRKPQSIKTALYRMKAGLPLGAQPKSKKEGTKK